jgi:hypothetical protein
MAFDTKVRGRIGFETLQARKGLGLPLAHVQKGSILHLIDSERFERASSLNSGMRMEYDKDYSSEDISFPLVKGFREEGSPNRKTDSPHMKHPGIHEDPSWEKCLKEPSWRTKDTKRGCSK